MNDNEDDVNDGYDSGSQRYAIDSIYGNRNAPVHLKVTELTLFSQQHDPMTTLKQRQTIILEPTFMKMALLAVLLMIVTNCLGILFYYEDDPETPDVDETTQVETRLSQNSHSFKPGFSTKTVNEEKQTLKNQNYFNAHIKGQHTC